MEEKRPNLKILDIGCGSGCIAISLAIEMDHAEVFALDIDGGALDISLQNAKKFDVHMEYILEDILTVEHLGQKFDIIVSNPPYVLDSQRPLISNNVLAHEPHKALFVPDHDPLLFYKKIVSSR